MCPRYKSLLYNFFFLSLLPFFATPIIGRSLPSKQRVIYALGVGRASMVSRLPLRAPQTEAPTPLMVGRRHSVRAIVEGGEDYALPFFLYLLPPHPIGNLLFLHSNPCLPPPSTLISSPPTFSYLFLQLQPPLA